MGPESDLHREFKRVAARWLWDQGYAAAAGVGGIEGSIARSLTAGNMRRGAAAPFDRYDSTVELSVAGRQVS